MVKPNKPATRTKATGVTKPAGDSPKSIAPEPDHPIDKAVDKFFLTDERAREALSRNINKRSASAIKAEVRAQAAFDGFLPSKYSAQELVQRNYVSSDVSPAAATRTVVDKGVEVMRASAQRRAIKINLGGIRDDLIEKTVGGEYIGKAKLSELMAYIQTRMDGGVLTVPTDSAFTECQAEAEAQRRLDQILGKGPVEDPATDVVTESSVPDDPEPKEVQEYVGEQVRVQMGTATSPEQKLSFAVPSRTDPKQTDKAVETFELRAGPADVTSYHDFNSLQIAFEHVWQEIFDGRIAKLGEELYKEYVRLQEFVGVDPADKSIDTVDDLRGLMDDIRKLGNLANEATPTRLQSKDETGASNTTAKTPEEAVNDFINMVDPANSITSQIGNDTIETLLDPAGALIKAIAKLIIGYPKLTWAALPCREPVSGGDMVRVRIEPNAVEAGTVEIQLQADDGIGWKGMNFIQLDDNGKPTKPWGIVTANPDDPMVYDKNSYNRLPVRTQEAERAYLEFWHVGAFSFHGPSFVMDGLKEKLTDGTRVTFIWTKG